MKMAIVYYETRKNFIYGEVNLTILKICCCL